MRSQRISALGLNLEETKSADAIEATATRRSLHRPSGHLFFISLSLAISITVLLGFAPTFYLRTYFHPDPLPPLLILHGLVFSSWIVLLLVQTTLITAKKPRLHKRLGIAGAVLALLVIVVGVSTAILRTKVDASTGSGPLAFLTIPLGDMLVFGILVGCALKFRHRVDVHKRLMILATLTILPAAVARLPLGFIFRIHPLTVFALSDLFIVPLFVYDFLKSGRLHRATILGGLLLIVSHPLRFVIGNTHVWLVFAAWLVGWIHK